SGVFNWALKGLHSFIENKGFYDSPNVKLMLEQFETESDTVRQFLDEKNYEKSLKETILIKDLYNEYKPFCYDIGSRSLSKSNFIKRLTAAGYVIKRANSGITVNLHRGNL
ncbi:MAG TPA: primase-like DNA-binding domain-containing protein, partial [Saprospiraceae bacterium]|nr:primase-like DNA-binding domain-containing protein [Saprospiraceae bacterium]